MDQRISGIVLHPTCLPGPYGIGEIGGAARSFADALVAMGQHLWQVLPLGPTTYGDSPYQSLSTFAGNHLLIDFADLREAGLLVDEDLTDYPDFGDDAIDFGPLIQARNRVLGRVAAAFANRADDRTRGAYARFCEENRDWLEDYALFVALKDHHGGKPWTEWSDPLRHRDPAALARARQSHAAQVETVRIAQFLFDHQWRALRAYCAERAIRIMGDIPIFVAHDSADVWSAPELFFLDEQGHCTVIAGVPPDYFSETGHRWGNPLYRWDRMAADGYAWWVRRVERTLEMVDLVRIDHFRGFEAYWEIPASEDTAINGQWVPGPREALFEAFAKRFDPMPIVAEDLGIITDEVEALRDSFDLPGMKVLQFILCNASLAEGDDPDDFPTRSVCYTGTHDNDTTVGWFAQLDEETQAAVLGHVGGTGAEIHWDFISTAWRSASNLAIAPLQDVLGLGGEARLNLPGRPSGNWHWRFREDELSDSVRRRLRQLTHAAGRSHRKPKLEGSNDDAS